MPWLQVDTHSILKIRFREPDEVDVVYRNGKVGLIRGISYSEFQELSVAADKETFFRNIIAYRVEERDGTPLRIKKILRRLAIGAVVALLIYMVFTAIEAARVVGSE